MSSGRKWWECGIIYHILTIPDNKSNQDARILISSWNESAFEWECSFEKSNSIYELYSVRVEERIRYVV